MKRELIPILGFWVLTGSQAWALDLYVAPNGNDAWSGRQAEANDTGGDGPFATIQRAQREVRRVRSDTAAAEAVNVHIRGGLYELTEPIVFTPDDSGTEAAPVVFTAYDNERPVFSGGRRITGWKEGIDGVWSAEVPEVKSGDWYFHQLFVDGRRATRGRTPNEGHYFVRSLLPGVGTPREGKDNPESRLGFEYEPGQFEPWDNLDDVNVFVYQAWTAAMFWIKSLDTESNLVHFTAESNWPIGYWGWPPRFIIENYRKALDEPGEWYLDRTEGRLYYMPREDEEMSAAEIIAPKLHHLVRFDGDWRDGRLVEHVTLRGLSFQHAMWQTPREKPADGQAAAWLKAAVQCDGMSHCKLIDCEVAHVGEYGIHLHRACQHNRIERCHVYDLGAGGIRVGMTQSPSQDSHAASHNVIDNCFIHDGGHVFHAGVGMWIGRADNITVSHNEICDFDYTGISVGWMWGYKSQNCHDNIIEYNHVYNIGRGVLSDMGGIYTLGIQHGTVVRNNCFHHIYAYSYGGWGLYTDEGSYDIVMENNIVYDCKQNAFHQHYGRENVIRNNILAFGRQGQIALTRPEAGHRAFTIERNIVYSDTGYTFHGNWHDREEFEFDYNCYWDASGTEMVFPDGQTFEEWQAEGFDENSIIADPMFVDPANRDFRLKSGSPALKLGFKPIDRSEIGLYGDKEWTSLPKRLRGTDYYYPPEPEPTLPENDFESAEIDSLPKGGHAREEPGATIRVSSEQAHSGKQSLKFTDRPGLQAPYNPHLYYNLNVRSGVVTTRFSLWRGPGTHLYHQWRDSRHPYRVGPSLRFHADGTLTTETRELCTLPDEKWIAFEIQCGLGTQSDGTFDLVVTVAGEEPQRFDDVPTGSPDFHSLNWLGFVAEKPGEQVFYLDDLKVTRTETWK